MYYDSILKYKEITRIYFYQIHFHIIIIFGIIIIMSKTNIITRTLSKFQQRYTQFQSNYGPKFNTFVDKYKIIKVGCIFGTCNYRINIVLNSYYIYDGTITAIVLNQTRN